MARIAAAAFLLGALVLFMTLPAQVTAASSSEDVKKESKEAWSAFKDYLHDQKHDAVEYGRKQLKKADAEIDELEVKADKASGEAKDEYRKTIKNLKKLSGNKVPPATVDELVSMAEEIITIINETSPKPSYKDYDWKSRFKHFNPYWWNHSHWYSSWSYYKWC